MIEAHPVSILGLRILCGCGWACDCPRDATEAREIAWAHLANTSATTRFLVAFVRSEGGQ